MKRSSFIKIFATVSFLVLFRGSLYAQFPEDALRLSYPGMTLGARFLGMGNAATGLADDYTAIYWNPAGLAQLRNSEISGSIYHFSYNNKATFFGNTSSYSNTNTAFNNLGLVYPFPTKRGSLVLAVGFNRVNDFTTGLSFDGFNPSSSIIPTLYNSSYDLDMAYQLYLEDSTGYTPFTKDVQQRGKVLEDGGLNNWSFAGAVEAAKGLSIGITLSLVTGSYSYTRNYSEFDSRNFYQAYPWDFNELDLVNNISSDISGIGATFGLLYQWEERFRLGLTLKTPTYYTVKENFKSAGNSYFDNGDSYKYTIPGSDEYDVVSPFTFGGGASLTIAGLTVAGSASYTDYSEMQFRNAAASVLNENTTIKEIFRPTTNIHFGAEYIVPLIGLRLRGGYMYRPSPYKGDPSSYDQKIITGGIGLLLQEQLMIDLGFARATWQTYHVNYDPSSRTDESLTTNILIVGLSYRF
ncbi:MAG: OmpP1/FadL family transporter [Bacteroidota bacterium]